LTWYLIVPLNGDAAQNVSFELNPDWVGIEDRWLDLAPSCENEPEALHANEKTTIATVAKIGPTLTIRRIAAHATGVFASGAVSPTGKETYQVAPEGRFYFLFRLAGHSLDS
jgi:hypothetical protein